VNDTHKLVITRDESKVETVRPVRQSQQCLLEQLLRAEYTGDAKVSFRFVGQFLHAVWTGVIEHKFIDCATYILDGFVVVGMIKNLEQYDGPVPLPAKTEWQFSDVDVDA